MNKYRLKNGALSLIGTQVFEEASREELRVLLALIERGFDPLVYRFFCMQSHYRKNLVFSWDNLERLCGLLKCQPSDLIEYVEEEV